MSRVSDFGDAILAMNNVYKTLNAFHAGKLSETKMADIIAETFEIKNPKAKAALLAGHLELWDV